MLHQVHETLSIERIARFVEKSTASISHLDERILSASPLYLERDVGLFARPVDGQHHLLQNRNPGTNSHNSLHSLIVREVANNLPPDRGAETRNIDLLES